MRFYLLIFLSFTILGYSQSNTKLVDSLLLETKKDTSYVQLDDTDFIHFSREKIDSINAIKVQGVGISQDSLKRLLEATILSAKAIGYQKGAADAYLNLGVNYYYIGNYKANFESQLEAIKIYETIGENALAAKAYGELGYSSRRRDLNMANSLMQKAIQLAKTDSVKSKVQDIYNNYSILKLMEKKYDSAKYFVKKGLVIKEAQKDSFGIPYSYANLANTYVEEGNLNEALVYFTKALDIRKKINDSIGLGESYVQIAEVLKQQNKLNKALDNFKSSMYYASKKKYGRLLSYNYYQLSDIYKKTNKTDSALHYLEQHLKLKDSLEGQEVLEELASLRVKFDTEKKEKEILSQRADLAEKELDLSKKNIYILGLGALAVVLGLLGYLFYNQQKLKNRQLQKENQLKDALLKIETQSKLQEQRLRISRDLHDNIGAQLTFIISSLDNLRYGFKIPEKLGNKLRGISEFTTTTIHELRDTIWAMNKDKITFEDLQIRISNFIDQANLAAQNIKFSFNVDTSLDDDIAFTSVKGMNIYRIIQEAINNALKYAEATYINVDISEENNKMIVRIKDNGKGFDENSVKLGNGLNNMKKRAEDIKAQLSIQSVVGEGTDIRLQI
ncbi:MAG: two-component sensor histidine kinase [Flavobacteriaceae bacterium]|nr:two-component sensor histidine kinase [Flavobacteriaceae bacterium]MBD09191.1 two-component sensor histidine kinase [Flavobacteriaceae bacterium]|tara:strand:- start:11051 stop:12901 length:1851 start_codon:yes stop_codon:yes gene_type:complete